jgi:hypothetical protein
MRRETSCSENRRIFRKLVQAETVAARRVKNAAAMFRRLPVKKPSSDQGTERMAETGEMRLLASTGKTAAARLAAMPHAMPAAG